MKNEIFMGSLWCSKSFRWDKVCRAQLCAKLDAYYARLYGLTRDELRYILDPKEVHGEDFPGETFRVLKEKEVRLYGEYICCYEKYT
jgi:hypothetical protein